MERVDVESIDLGQDAEKLSLEDVQIGRAGKRVARVQRFRLFGPDGRIMVRPRRVAATLFQESHQPGPYDDHCA